MSDSGATRSGEPKQAAERLLGRPLSGLRLGIAGPGRVGSSFALWARRAGAELRLVVRRTPKSGRQDTLQAVSSASFDSVFAAPAPVDGPLDVLLLAVSDDALATVATSWASDWTSRSVQSASAGLRPDPPCRAVLHSSGCFDAEILAPLRAAGIAVGSLHPLRAFAEVASEPGPHPFFAVDGDPEALALARRLAEAWGGTCCELSGERRVVYHLAASLAAGGVVTTLAVVTELMRRAELPDEVLGGYLDLLRGAVDAAEQRAVDGGPGALASAITGPAARGDEKTIERHRKALLQVAPELAPTVDTLWRETRRQTKAEASGDG